MWGLDPEEHQNYKRPNLKNEESVAKRIRANYPDRWIRTNTSGVIRLRVIVEANGEVSECHLVKGTDSEALSPRICRHMELAEFDPAVNADGEPMRTYYTRSITYVLL